MICGTTLTATLQLQDGINNLGTVSYDFTIGVDNGGGFVCVAPCGGVQLVVTSSLTRTTASMVQATINVQNNGSFTANNVVLTTGKLGGTTGTSLPQSLGDIPPGGWAASTLFFENSASGASVLSLGGTYTGGTFTSTRRLTIP